MPVNNAYEGSPVFSKQQAIVVSPPAGLAGFAIFNIGIDDHMKGVSAINGDWK